MKKLLSTLAIVAMLFGAAGLAFADEEQVADRTEEVREMEPARGRMVDGGASGILGPGDSIRISPDGSITYTFILCHDRGIIGTIHIPAPQV